jgi:RHS repeat-associated protein
MRATAQRSLLQNETRTHNKVNELTDRDTNSSAPAEYATLGYDGAGNLTDDKESYKYEYDALYRLRKVKSQSNALVAEYWYNGLGYRLTVHQDTDTDGDVDASDKKYHFAYDERWRIVSTFRESDSSPKEEFAYHAAGLDARGGASYIDLIIMRLKDANTAWTAASDGTLEERIVYCQNWRADVSALVTSGGTLKEWVKYSAYGVPYGIPGGDTDTNFATADADLTQVQSWIDGSQYNVLGDIDLDGDVDTTDKSTIQNNYAGTTLGRGVMTAPGVNNRSGYGGCFIDSSTGFLSQVRNQVFNTVLGRWLQRDLVEYADSLNLYEYIRSAPIADLDPTGLGGPCIPDGCLGWTEHKWFNARGTTCTGKWSLQMKITQKFFTSWGTSPDSAHCSYGLHVDIQTQIWDDNIGDWRPINCGDGASRCDKMWWEFWHGAGTPCGFNYGWPKWAGPGTQGKDGSSRIGIDIVTPTQECNGFLQIAAFITVASWAGPRLNGLITCTCSCPEG